ncbi:MAG: hypothetical protein IKE73_05110 [Bacilli bacterium]|nr:hypothetical protein [Bacilli bacterium]
MPEEEQNVPELSIVDNNKNNIIEMPKRDNINTPAEDKINSINASKNANINNNINSNNTNVPSNRNESDIPTNDLDNNKDINQDNEIDNNKSEDSNNASDDNKTDDSNNVDNNYSKANSGREAYERKLNDKDYYDKQKNNNQDKMEKLKNDRDELNKKKDASNERLQKAKENTAGRNRSQQTKEEKKENKEANKENKELKKEEKNLKKEEKNLKKESKSIAKDERKAKIFAITHPLEALKLKLKKFLLMTVLPKVLVVILIIIAFCFILESIFEVFERVDKVVRGVANFHEKLDNFVNGLGFYNSEQAFYKEMDKLNKYYSNELDTKLLMATVFYPDIEDALENDIDSEYGTISSATAGEDIMQYGSVLAYINDVIKDSNETVDRRGLVFTSNKIYRLRRLAKHQLKDNGQTETKPLTDYIKKIAGQLGTTFIDIIKEAAIMAVQLFLGLKNPNLWESVYQSLFKGENFFMTDTGAHIEALGTSFVRVFEILLDGFLDIKDVSFCGIDELIGRFGEAIYDILSLEPIDAIKQLNPLDWFDITYAKKTLNEEYYYEYLRTKYIPNMPEFEKELAGLSEDSDDYKREVNNIIRRIKEIRDNYEDYFGEKEENAEFYSDEYSGLVRPSLVSELVKPVNPPSGSTITFSGKYSYGTLGNGLQQQGIEINKNTTGNDEGDSVYSIYHHGKVEESTYDNTFTNSDYKGGSVKISYEASLSDGNYRFYAIYSGLDPSSLTLSKGDIVEQNQVIGKIGSINDSNTDVPSLFFSMYNTGSNESINPINLYIAISNKLSIRGDSNVEKIWNYLIDYGFSAESAAGIIANWNAESSLEPQRVQGTGVGSDYSISYTNQVDSGIINRQAFAHNGPNGGGYGLAQWTHWAIKEGMYDYWKTSGLSIGSLDFQLSWFIYSIENIIPGVTSYKSLFQKINAQSSPEEAAYYFCSDYERPAAGCSLTSERSKSARGYYDSYRNLPRQTYYVTDITASDASSSSSIGTSAGSPTATSSSSASLKKMGSFDNFLFIGDSRTKGMKDSLKNLGSNVTVIGAGGSDPRNWASFTTSFAGFSYMDRDKNGNKIYYTFPKSASGISVAIGVNGPSDGTELSSEGIYWPNHVSYAKKTLNNLLEHYPGVPIYVNSVIHQRSDFYSKGYGYGEIRASVWNKMIDRYNNYMKEYCNTNPNLYYIDVSEGFDDSVNSKDYSDGLHFSSTGSAKYIKNLKSKILSTDTSGNTNS